MKRISGWLWLTSALWLGCARSAPPAAAPPPPETEDCPAGAHRSGGRCVAIDPECPPGHALKMGAGCVPTDGAPPPAPPAEPPTRTRLADDLSFEELVVGAGAALPPDAVVRVRYEGRLDDGTPFDRSPEGGEGLRLTLGKRHLIPGWEEGLPGMRVGGKRRLFVGPKKGYGARGAPPRIPPHAHLVFDVELVGFEPTPPVRPTPDRAR